jgi:hypothetical protein
MNCVRQSNSQEAETADGLANGASHRKSPAGKVWVLSSLVDLPTASRAGCGMMAMRNDGHEEDESDSEKL